MNGKGKIPCTVYIMTLNGAAVLPRALESVQDYAEVIVTDGNSTDGTQDIARRYGARLIKQTDSDEPDLLITDFAAVQNRCIKEATFDWIFQLDMDEAMSPELNEEIRHIVSTPVRHFAYYVPRRTIYKGKVIRYSTGYRDYTDTGFEMKLFNRTSGCSVVKSPHHRLEFDQVKYPVAYLTHTYDAFFTIPIYNEGKHYPKRFMDMEIVGVRKQSLRQFLYWTVGIRSLKTAKKFLRFLWLYARYGFKDTFPPKVEFAKIQYSWLIMTGAIQERLTGRHYRT